MRMLIPAVLAAAMAATAQPVSFRAMSTGNMLLDDIDVWASGMLFTQPVPDRLMEVEGVRVYTGLANLATGEDMIFGEADSVRGGFLVGGSWTPVGSSFGVGLLGGLDDDRDLESLSIMGPGDSLLVSGSGEVEGAYSEFTDTNGDGVLDTRRTAHLRESGWRDTTETQVGAFGAYAPSETMRFGLGLTLYRLSTEHRDSDMNFGQSFSDSNLTTGEPTLQEDLTAEGSDKEERNGISIFLSGGGDVSETFELRGMFTFSPVSSEMTHYLSESGTRDLLPGDEDAFDISSWNRSVSYTVSPSGNRFGGGAHAAIELEEGWDLELGASFYSLSLSGSSSDYTMNMDSTYLLTVGSLVDSTVVDGGSTGNTDLDVSESMTAALAKLVASPIQRFKVSIGLGMWMSDHTGTMVFSNDMTSVVTHSDGDDEMNDPDDYVSTTTWSQSEQGKTTESTTRVALPVGVEFEILPYLFGRLGASPALVWEETVETMTLLSATPMVTTTVYGDGTEDQSVQDPWTTYDGTRTATDESYTEIPLSYGVGFIPNKHLKIDLMGLGSDFSEWRLSATLAF